MPFPHINPDSQNFKTYATLHPDLRFHVTAIGTGLAGYSHSDIAPMFANAPANCDLPEEWRGLVVIGEQG